MNIGLYLCTGIGGARHGFLAGWLGTLPNFIDNQWRIDLETGHSDGYMNIAKDIECGMSFNQFLNNRSFVLSDRADLFMAGQLHGHALIPYHEDIDYNCVRVLNVDVTHADPAQVQWDFLVKTYLRKDRAKQNYEENAVQWNIDKSINQLVVTDQDRVEKFKLLATRMAQSRPQDPMLDSQLKFVNLDYEQLFQMGGTRYLCDQLNISVDQKYHDYWNQQLPWARSRNTLTVWNTVWNKSDFFN